MPLGQLHMPRTEDRPQSGGRPPVGRDNDGRGGRDNDWRDHSGGGSNGRGDRDWGDHRGGRDNDWRGDRDRNHWHGGHDRHESHWGRRNSWRHHDHSNWSIGFSFGPSYSYGYWPSYSYSRPVLYSSYSYSPWYSGWSTRYYSYSDPLCISYRPSSSYWWYYRRPLSYSLIYPVYDTTTYVTYDTPVYTETATYLYGSTIPSYSSTTTILDYSAKLPADYRAYTTQSQPAASTYSVPAAEEPVIVYQASRQSGEMVWSDTATSIVNSLLNSSERGGEAQRYLGKSIAGSWEVTLESARQTDTGMELTTRAMAAAGTGVRPTIVVNIRRVEAGLQPGQRLSITGRLSELTVNDPENAGGLLVLDDADVSW